MKHSLPLLCSYHFMSLFMASLIGYSATCSVFEYKGIAWKVIFIKTIQMHQEILLCEMSGPLGHFHCILSAGYDYYQDHEKAVQ